jgi:uncharacterized protein (UPF0335 family)
MKAFVREQWVAILFALLTFTASYAAANATFRYQLDANTERIEKLEQNQITQREYQELISRLGRIENKVDELGRDKQDKK